MRTVFIGRFQPLHQGHKNVIEDHFGSEEDFAVVIGSADKEREEKNPLSADEREEIIKACFPSLEIFHLEDEGQDEEGNKRWIENLKDLGVDKVISRNDLVKELVEEDYELELLEQDLYDPDIYSGTEVRRRIRSGEEWRYLVPDCCEEQIADKVEVIRKSGIDYDFNPGWTRENAYHETFEK